MNASVGMLSDYDEALGEFDDVCRQLDSCLCVVDGIDHRRRHEVANLAHDIVSAAAGLRSAHEHASHAIQAQELRLSLFGPGLLGSTDEADDSGRRLRMAYKQMFVLIRAYQDALCRVLLILAGQAAGKGTSMKTAMNKPGNPCGDSAKTVEGYEAWFEDWREKRNAVKDGVSFSLAGPGSNVGISFSRVNGETGGIVIDCQDAVRLLDAARAIAMSTKLTRIAKARAEESARSL